MFDLSLIGNPTGHESIEAFVLYILNFAVSISVILAVIALIIAGFKYILAMGDEEKVKDATKSLVFALVGLAIVFIAPILVQYIVSNFLGIS